MLNIVFYVLTNKKQSDNNIDWWFFYKDRFDVSHFIGKNLFKKFLFHLSDLSPAQIVV